jgi:hypothetical protein
VTGDTKAVTTAYSSSMKYLLQIVWAIAGVRRNKRERVIITDVGDVGSRDA